MVEGIEAFVTGAVQGGFSVLVTAFLLVRMEKELKLLRRTIEHLQHCQTCRMSPWLNDFDWSSMPDGGRDEV